MSRSAVPVSSLVKYLKGKLENDSLLQKVLVEGEISNFSSYRSGHWYFSLKDAQAQIRCVMFASSNRRVEFMPRDGDKVLVQADVSVYEARGDIQLIVSAMKPAGIGDLYLQYEQLKKRLEEAGYFDESHKKPIPSYPFSIALVTGRNTAARMDVLTTLARRWPAAEITEYPVLVQGTESAAQIRAALKKADDMDHDVILLVRGGGSIENLWSFNDEELAKVIYNLDTPIITGVGHETDFTIADFVSDLRAPTPTGAAERCSPDIRVVINQLDDSASRLERAMNDTLLAYRQELEGYMNSPVFRNPHRLYSEKAIRLENLTMSLDHGIEAVLRDTRARIEASRNSLSTCAGNTVAQYRAEIQDNRNVLLADMKARLDKSRNGFAKTAALLDAYSPLKVLARGYSVALKDGKAVTSASQTVPGDELNIMLSEGSLAVEVKQVKEEG